MGVILDALTGLIGPGASAIERTAQIFRPNADAQDARDAHMQAAALAQLAAEFDRPAHGFDRVMDALNRLPRPMLALSTLGFFAAAMISPPWFAARMQALAQVPEPLWWLLGVIVSFYFGARHQAKAIEWQKTLRRAPRPAPAVTDHNPALQGLIDAQSSHPRQTGT